MTVEIGTAIGQEVGSKVELVSINAPSQEHVLELSEGLAAAGVTVKNSPKGLYPAFTMAADNNFVFGAKKEAANEAIFAQPTRDVTLGQKFG